MSPRRSRTSEDGSGTGFSSDETALRLALNPPQKKFGFWNFSVFRISDNGLCTCTHLQKPISRPK